MSKEPNNIDRLIREKLDGFEMTPPESVWTSTSSALSAKRRKRFFIWFMLGFGALLIAGGMYFFIPETGKSEELVAQHTQKDSSKEKMETSGVEEGVDETPMDDIDSDAVTVQTTPSTKMDTSKLSESNSTNDAFNPTYSSKKSNAKTKSSGSNDSKVDEQKGLSLNQTNDNKVSKPEGVEGQNFSTKNESGSGNELSMDASSDKQTSSAGISTSTKRTETDGQTSSSSIIPSPDSSELRGSLPLNPIMPIPQPKGMLVSFEQEHTPPFVKSPFWKAFSLEASMGVSSFRNIPSSEGIDPLILTALNNAASDQFSLDARFGVNYHFTDRFSFGSGLQYNASRENYQYKSEEVVPYTVVDSITYTVDTSLFDTTYITHTSVYDSSIIASGVSLNTYRIFSLPFQFNWTQPISPRSALEFSVGGAVSLFGTNTGVVLPDTSDFTIDAQEGYHTSGMLSVGGSMKYLYRFGNHHSVYVEPWIQLGVTNQSTPALNYESVRRRYGIRVGYRFYF